jgi:hypothetical protein
MNCYPLAGSEAKTFSVDCTMNTGLRKPLPFGKSRNVRSKWPYRLSMNQNVMASLPKCLRIKPCDRVKQFVHFKLV